MSDQQIISIDNSISNSFASELRRLRRRRGLSQVALAQRAQISERAVRYWEAGTTFPGQWEIQSVLTVLALELSERAHLVSLLPNRRGTQIARQEMAGLVQAQGGALGDPPSLGDLLRAMRLRCGFTQSQIAEQVRVTTSTVLRWESTGSLPSDDNLERLCALYDAHPEERRVLQSRRMQNPLGETIPVTLEGFEEKVARLTEAVFWPDSPLIDLRALLLKHELWPLAASSEHALHLLVTVQVRHALFLSLQNRLKEATACINQGFALFHGRTATHVIWRELLNVAEPLAGKGPSKPESALRLIEHWRPFFPNHLQTRLWCDMAVYAGRAGKHEYAKHCLKQAKKRIPLSSEAAYLSEDYFPMSQAKVLIFAGRPWEAMNWLAHLPMPKHAAISQSMYQMYWIEALIDAGEKSRAQTLLGTLSGLLARFPQPQYEPRFARLAARV